MKTSVGRRLRRLLVVLHRWTALIFGLLLVVVSTSGALIVYEPELLRAGNAAMFRTTAAAQPVGFGAAVEAVAHADADFVPTAVALKDGVYLISGPEDTGQTYFVDAGTAAVNGTTNLYGGAVGFLENLHDCGLTCAGYRGYTPWLTTPSPLSGLPAFADMTWGALLLALAAGVLVLLAVTAPFLWWPGIRKWRNGFRVRWNRSRFARDFDLHNVIGVVAIIPLLIWGLTGLHFEVPGFSAAWFSATGGEQPPSDNYEVEPSDHQGALITIDRAVAVAQQRFPGSRATWVGLPEDPQEPGAGGGFYSVDVLDGGPNLWAHSAVYEGNRSVGVDAHDAENVRVFLGRPATVSNAIADEWAQPALHYGHAVNGYWRAVWFVLGMAPLLLMLTGLSTWFYRRQVNRRRATAAGQP